MVSHDVFMREWVNTHSFMLRKQEYYSVDYCLTFLLERLFL